MFILYNLIQDLICTYWFSIFNLSESLMRL